MLYLRVTSFLFAAPLLAGGAVLAADTPAVTSEVLLKSTSSWDGTAYIRYPDGAPELTTLKITIPPRTELP